MVEMVAADDGSLIYRTPPVVRALVVALLVGDLVAVEVILQTSMVIPALLQGAIVLLVIGLAVGLVLGPSSFLTVRAGPVWLAVHRLSWNRVGIDDIASVQVLGFSPRLCSLTFIAEAADGQRRSLRLGSVVMRDSTVREHAAEVVVQARELGRLGDMAPSVCLALGLDAAVCDPAQNRARLPAARIIGTVIGSTAAFVIGIRSALADEWGPPLAMGFAAALATTLLLMWIMGPSRWPTTP